MYWQQVCNKATNIAGLPLSPTCSSHPPQPISSPGKVQLSQGCVNHACSVLNRCCCRLLS